MDRINPEFHNQRCRVYTAELGETPLIGIVAVGKSDTKIIMVDDRPVIRTSITDINLDEADL